MNEMIEKKERFRCLVNSPPMNSEPGLQNIIKILCISDTHMLHEEIDFSNSPSDCDIIIHAGDFCGWSKDSELKRFRHWFRALPFKHKIVIAGNHDWPMDWKSSMFMENGSSRLSPFRPRSREMALLFQQNFKRDGIHYLEDSGVNIMGLNFWGSPWQPPFYDWAFQLPESKLAKYWEMIPITTDILITHTPPYGILDNNGRGSETLMARIHELKLKAHIFGHIHESHGLQELCNGTVFVNAAICDISYNPTNWPIAISIGVPNEQKA